MGDRANVVIQDVICRDGVETIDSCVYLYTHWAGTELPGVLQAALRRRERWDDPDYLARIVFSSMIDGSLNDTTGYGISSKVRDGQDRLLIVIPSSQRVSRAREDAEGVRVLNSWSFEEFLQLDLTTGDHGMRDPWAVLGGEVA